MPLLNIKKTRPDSTPVWNQDVRPISHDDGRLVKAFINHSIIARP